MKKTNKPSYSTKGLPGPVPSGPSVPPIPFGSLVPRDRTPTPRARAQRHEITITISGSDWPDVIRYLLRDWHADRITTALTQAPEGQHHITGSQGPTAYEVSFRRR